MCFSNFPNVRRLRGSSRFISFLVPSSIHIRVENGYKNHCILSWKNSFKHKWMSDTCSPVLRSHYRVLRKIPPPPSIRISKLIQQWRHKAKQTLGGGYNTHISWLRHCWRNPTQLRLERLDWFRSISIINDVYLRKLYKAALG